MKLDFADFFSTENFSKNYCSFTAWKSNTGKTSVFHHKNVYTARLQIEYFDKISLWTNFEKSFTCMNTPNVALARIYVSSKNCHIIFLKEWLGMPFKFCPPIVPTL